MLKKFSLLSIFTCCLISSVLAAPINDDLSDASIISAVPFSVSASNVDATMEVGEPWHANSNPGKSVWYSWTPSTTQFVGISTAGSEIDTILAVYTGSGYPLSQVASNDDSNGELTSSVSFEAQAGTNYKIAVAGYDDGSGGDSGTFQLAIDVASPLPPEHDNFADADVIFSTNMGRVSNNYNATAEPNENAHAGQPASHSVWYKWIAPVTANLQFNTSQSGIDTVLGAYTGNSFPLTEIASNDNFGSNLYSQLDLDVVKGTTYYFAVDGKAGATGVVSFAVYGAPENDNLDNATVLTTQDVSTYGSNITASAETNENDHAGMPANMSIWWSWTPPDSGVVSINTNNTGIDTVLAVYTGTQYPLTLVAEDDDSGDDTASSVTISVTGGTSYYIAVDSRLYSTSNVRLNIQGPTLPAPFNDNLADAAPVLTIPDTMNGTNAGATREQNEPSHAGQPGDTSVWWSWTATVGGQVKIDTVGSDFDTVLAVYTGDNYPLTEIASDDESGGSNTSSLEFEAIEGTIYKIAVSGFSNDSGNIILNFDIAPETGITNDNLANATAISSAMPVTVNGTNAGATREANEPDHAQYGYTSVWWSWTPATSGTVTIDTYGSDFDTLLGVYTGTNYPLTLVANNDDGENAPNYNSLVTIAVQAGVTYQIAVDGLAGNSGNITLNITSVEIPANDNLADATIISSLPTTINATNVLATREANESDHASEPGGASVWWSWTSDINGLVTVSTVGSNFDTLLAVYTGNSLPLTVVARDDEGGGSHTSKLVFTAVSGTTYKIAVDGYEGDTGNITLIVESPVPPSNDNLASATILPGGDEVELEDSNVAATKETGEPNHGGNAGGASVWYSWTAPSTGRAFITTINSSFRTILSVYTGEAYPLTLLAEHRNTGPVFLGSQVEIDVIGGNVYKIAVDGVNGAQGSISLFIVNAPPYLEATTRLDANPTSSTDVNYGIKVSEAVTGVDSTDFRIAVSSGISTATVTSVEGSGSSYTVTVNVAPGDGTVSLTVLQDGSILDIDEYELVDGPWGPENTALYTIDRTAPVISTLTPVDAKTVSITFTDASAMGTGVVNPINYTVSGAGRGSVDEHPTSVAFVSGKTYQLTWNTGGMVNGQPIAIGVSNVYDVAGNKISESSTGSGTALPVSLSAFTVE